MLVVCNLAKRIRAEVKTGVAKEEDVAEAEDVVEKSTWGVILQKNGQHCPTRTNSVFVMEEQPPQRPPITNRSPPVYNPRGT